jgi:hypothetical protein
MRLDADILPERLRTMSPKEREAFVLEKREQRNALKEQIAKVSTQRDAYVVAEQQRRTAAGEGDGFDQQVLEAIRSQAGAKGIAY